MSDTLPLPRPPALTSGRFFSPYADVTFQSSDGVLFKIHRKNLDCITGEFPPSGIASPLEGEIVPLTETAAVLELLFQFIYPERHPELEDEDFTVLAPLAEAVEKYQVYSAMTICKIRMRNVRVLPEHAPEVLNYAAKHRYLDVVDQAAPLTIGIPLRDMMAILAPNLIVPWITYHEEWVKVLKFAASAYGNSLIEHGDEGLWCNCPKWAEACAHVISNLAGNVGSLRALDHIFLPRGPRVGVCYEPDISGWHNAVSGRVNQIPPFRTFL